MTTLAGIPEDFLHEQAVNRERIGVTEDQLRRVASGDFRIIDNGNGEAKILFGVLEDTNLYRSAADTLKSDDGVWGVGGMVTKTKAGVPDDSDLVAGMQQSGAFILDTTNSRIYFRVGSTWKFAALT